jgi:hypothetical protein
LGYDGHIIRTRLGVIVPLQADRMPVVDGRVIFHDVFFADLSESFGTSREKDG